ncbi:chorismate mutase [Caulobacter sp. KR2-114]|uniref:chorismate mutase n=1 Tax=Caulobacter sp. KR2-114 TaxID=3400912 RepID=UPI003C08758E
MTATEIETEDDLDLALLRRLAQRVAAASAAIAAAGPRSLVSADEEHTLRRLIRVRAGGLRAPALVRIWRELVAEARAAQAPVTLALCAGADPGRAVDHARLSFGSARLALQPQPEAALAAARAGAVAILPLDAGKPWWGRLLAEPALQVFAALPCLAQLGDTTALAVAQTAPEPTGADQTFWVTDAPGPASGVLAALARDGVAGEPLAEAGGLKLFALVGFYQAHDPRLARAPGRLSGVIGAAPTPLDV